MFILLMEATLPSCLLVHLFFRLRIAVKYYGTLFNYRGLRPLLASICFSYLFACFFIFISIIFFAQSIIFFCIYFLSIILMLISLLLTSFLLNLLACLLTFFLAFFLSYFLLLFAVSYFPVTYSFTSFLDLLVSSSLSFVFPELALHRCLLGLTFLCPFVIYYLFS